MALKFHIWFEKLYAILTFLTQAKLHDAPPQPQPPPVINAHEKFAVSGVGISEPKVGAVNEIYVQSTDNYPMEDVQVNVTGPDFKSVPVTHEEKNPQLRVYKYVPEQAGNYNVDVKYRGQHVPRSPTVVSAKNDLTKIRVHGDSLGGKSCFLFHVECKGFDVLNM